MLLKTNHPKYTLKQKLLLFKQSIQYDYESNGILGVVLPNIIYRNLRRAKYKIKNFFFPHNVVKVKTLPKSWTETDELIIHANFQILTDYVVKQWEGGKSVCFGKLFDLTEYKKNIEDHPEDEWRKQELESIVRQNKDTQEIWDLYNWWTKERPKRVDPDELYFIADNSPLEFEISKVDADGLPELFTLKHHDETPENKAKRLKGYEDSFKLEEKYNQEDTDMLCRLIKVRGALWT